MKTSRERKPPLGQLGDASPARPIVLTPPTKGTVPRADDLSTEPAQPCDVHGYRVVRKVAAHYRLEPLALNIQSLVATPQEILTDRM